jgi:FMN phosphatase YigB (HAD superfamily)
MSKQLLKTYIRQIIKETLEAEKKLRVFDLDDTLVKTNSKVHITKASGEELYLTPAKYAVYEKEPGDIFDYSDFQGLVDPKAIGWTTKILKRVINKHGTDAAVILTARGSEEPAREFFRLYDIPEIPIVALGNSDPEMKAQWIKYVAKKFGYKEIEFFDDSPKNIAAVQRLKVPGVKIIARLILH